MGRKRLEAKILNCSWCRKPFSIRRGEHNRQIKRGRKLFFCSLNCAGFYSNSIRDNRVLEIKKICPECKRTFLSTTSKKSSTFCSRSCASKGSVTEYRRLKASIAGKENSGNFSIEKNAAGLRKREWWKYQLVDEFLNKINENHLFEYVIENFIYDLSIIDRKILIEFDSPYHEWKPMKASDREKDRVAVKNGWRIIRIKVAQNLPINPLVVAKVL